MKYFLNSPMYRYFLLELRKSRMVYLSLLGAVLISVPITLFYAWLYKMDIQPALMTLVMFWCVAGVAIAGVIQGGNAGAGLRAELNENAETVLPLSNVKRISAAIVSVMLLPLCGVLFGLLVLVFMAGYFRYLPVLYYTFTVYLSVAAFAFAYLSKNGVFGGIVGVVFGALAVLPELLGIGYFELKARNEQLYFLCTMVAAYGGIAAGIFVLSKYVGRGRRAGLLAASLLTICFLAGPVAHSGCFVYETLARLYLRPDFRWSNNEAGVFAVYRNGGL